MASILRFVEHNEDMRFNYQGADDMHQGERLTKLAAVGRFSERHSRRLIKRETGKTPGQLFRLERLQAARTLLATTTLSVTDIVFRSGFSSVRQFNTAFRQRYGASPRQLRQSLLIPAGTI